MTLARTALRFAALASLKGSADARPTRAAERVYDSRMAPLDAESFANDAKPVIIVQTDGDTGEALSKQNGGPPFWRDIELVLELGMVARFKVDAGYVLDYPDTDARLEASLDFLEFQVMQTLGPDFNVMPTVFQKICKIVKHESNRQVEQESGVKLASRLLTLTCHLQDPPGDRPLITGATAPTGLNLLPEPLRTVAQSLPTDSEAYLICSALAAGTSIAATGPFTGADIIVDGAGAAQGDSVADDQVAVTANPPQS